jgi:hypothetical protein
LSIHRPRPGTAHETRIGSARRGSPNATIGWENRALNWRTFLTVPAGAVSTLTRSKVSATAGAWARAGDPLDRPMATAANSVPIHAARA